MSASRSSRCPRAATGAAEARPPRSRRPLERLDIAFGAGGVEGRDMGVVLKSGNFGAPDFFTKALRMMEDGQ